MSLPPKNISLKKLKEDTKNYTSKNAIRPKEFDEELDKISLTEQDRKVAKEIFTEFWDDPRYLNYLREEDYDAYEKTYNFNWFEVVRDSFRLMEEHNKFQWFIKGHMYHCVPNEDKRIDFFVTHNPNWAFILNCVINDAIKLRDQLIKENEKKIQSIKNEVVQDVEKNLQSAQKSIELLKKWDDPRANDILKNTLELLEPLVDKKDTKPKGRNHKIIERNNEIRNRVDALVDTLVEVGGVKIPVTHKMAFKSLTKDYSIKEDTIKKIYYEYGWEEKIEKD